MDGPVIGAIITASVALVVSIGGAIRAMVSAAVDRRYERRREYLVNAQDAMLDLREALNAYGIALQETVTTGAEPADVAGPALLVAQDAPAGGSSFELGVSGALDLRVATARGRLKVAQSRLEDDAVHEALHLWTAVAGASMIDTTDSQAGSEFEAFDRVNDLIGSALRSARGMSTGAGRGRRALR